MSIHRGKPPSPPAEPDGRHPPAGRHITGGGTGGDGSDGELIWHDRDMPYSPRYGDHYYSRAGGLDETRHVFIAGNRLDRRWRDGQRFVIGELGFGTGLNFFATWRAWQAARGDRSHLHFVSVEAHPLSAADMKRALSVWPPIVALAAPVLARWPATPAGDIVIAADKRTTLTVFVGEASTVLARFETTADAWFLDGFAPARNPDMWSSALMRAVFERTAPGGTFATYTAAGWVRRNLAEAGFEVEKCPGFAGKRAMTCGRRPDEDGQARSRAA